MGDFLKKTARNLLSSHVSSMSSTRFLFLFVAAISNFIIFGMWILFSFYHGSLQPIPESVLVLYSLANGITMTGKVFQKNIESKYNTCSEDQEIYNNNKTFEELQYESTKKDMYR